jgi:multidrug efflux pump subunit AcrA (membrane-fusion protein)
MSEASIARRRTRRTRSRVIAASAAVCILGLAGGGVAVASLSGSSGDYRTVTARQGDVTQILDAVGTVAAADRYDLAFGVAGDVATVDVAVGDGVVAGAVLATLDTASLQDAVDEARTAVDDAESQLASDSAAQSSTSSSGSGTSSGEASSTATGAEESAGTAPTDGGTTDAGTTPTASVPPEEDAAALDPLVEEAVTAVASAREALLAQYDTASAALATSSDVVASSGTVCRTFLDAAFPESEESPALEPSTAADEDAGADDADAADGDAGSDEDAGSAEGAGNDGDTTGDDTIADDSATGEIADALDACQEAIGTVLANQSVVDDAQSELQERATALDEAVVALQAAAATSSSPAGTAESGGSSSSPSDTGETTEQAESPATEGASKSDEAGTGSGVADSTTVTAETLLADSAEITLAEQRLAVAEHQLAANTLTAPVSGTVAAVGMAAGDGVTAGSTTAVITVLADTGYVVDATIPVGDARSAEVGQAVAVSVEGSDDELDGTVSSVGVLDVSETSTPSFAVTVSFDDTDLTALTGTAASLAITAAEASDVVVVPTSAVHVSGTTSTVDVLADGELEARGVETGALGADYTEIVEGIESGDIVVLADLDQEILSDDTETSSGLSGIGGSSDTSNMPGGGAPGGVSPDGGMPPGGAPAGG